MLHFIRSVIISKFCVRDILATKCNNEESLENINPNSRLSSNVAIVVDPIK